MYETRKKRFIVARDFYEGFCYFGRSDLRSVPGIAKDFGVADYLKGHITVDGREMLTQLDWDLISREEFYQKLGDKRVKITTAPPNLEEYCEIFTKYINEGYGVLSMSISSKISGTYDFSCVAANRVREKHPQAEIYCFDSFRMSGAFGLLVAHAHRLKNEGKTMQEVIDWLEENKVRVHQMGPIDDLIYVARRGRITMGKAIMGSFAGVKPMGDCNSDGYTTVLTKAKGIKKALDITVKYVKETADGIEDQFLIISHSDRELYANTLKEMLEKELNPKKVYVSDVFAGSGANIGPGMIGVYYLGKPISPDLSAEKEAMNRILGK